MFNALDIGVQLLKREKCCGVPLIANGFIDQAKKQARVNAESLHEAVLERGIPVVATSSSCTFTLRDEYPICWTWTLPRCAIGWSWRRAISIA